MDNLAPPHYNAHDFSLEPNVSRETFEAFQAWEALLLRWNTKINLVSKHALSDFWKRHALDSWQLVQALPQRPNLNILDLGSGAGFPGIALAIGLKESHKKPVKGQTCGKAWSLEGGHVVMVDSAGKKVNFLRRVIRELDLPASAYSDRIESLEAKPYDIISARAFAPLPKLLTYAQPFWGLGTTGLFLKGIGTEEELTKARKYWTFKHETLPSRTDKDGVILKISDLVLKTDI